MISALIGSVIMSAVTVAMLIAINVTDKALTKVGLGEPGAGCTTIPDSLFKTIIKSSS